MRQRIPGICFCLSVWFAACVQDRAVAQPYVLDDPALTADSGQADCPIRYTLRHFAGDAPGYETGVTRFELFIPLMEMDASSLLFCDLQPLIDNDGNWGSNLGLGFRWYSPTFDRVFGAYGYFDYRETSYHRFQQGTFGFDTLGNWIDARANFYVPGQKQMELPAEAVAAPHFQGNSLRYGGYETAMLGGDLEFGVRVPVLMGTQSRLLAGMYYFDGNGEEDVTGWKARIETNWSANFSTDVALYDDDVFGTTVMVGLAFNIQAESFRPWAPQINSFRRGPLRHITNVAADRIAEPTYRQPSIAIRHGEYRATTSENPFQIIHVAEGATDGNGSFERPFGSLDEAMAVAQSGQIVYTPYGGSYQLAPMFVVPEGVALLSNAPVQFVQTDVGWIQLPLSGALPDLSASPEILGSVEMSSGSMLNGFRVVGTGDTLGEAGVVRIVGVSDVTVANNQIWSRQEGIWIEDAMNVTVAGNTVAQALGSGIFMAGGTDVTLTQNAVDTAGGHGIEVVAGAEAVIADNVVAMALGSGIAVTEGRHAQITGNLIGTVGQHGIEVIHGPSVNVANNQILAALGDGITLTDAVNASVTRNLIESAGGHGIEFITGTNATLADNQIGTVGGHGITLADAANANVTGNSIESAARDGIRVVEGAGATIAANNVRQAFGNGISLTYGPNAVINDNTVDWAGLHGLEVIAGAGTAILRNEIGTALGDGITLVHGPSSLISENRIGSARENGIEVVDGGGVVVSQNGIAAARANGIAVIHGANSIVANNQIDSVSGNSGDPASGNGITILDGTGAAISGNAVGTVSANGIRVADATDASVVDNEITFAGNHGIMIDAGTNAEISGNAIEHTRQHGIAVNDAVNAMLANNQVESAGGDGLHVTSGSNVEIRGNWLETIDHSGVALIGVEYGLVTNNTIEFAGRHGIQIIDGNHVDITANSVERAIGNGIDISGLDFLGTVDGNTITEGQSGIQAVLSGEFSGAVSGNSLLQNRVNGIYLEAGRFVDGSLVSENSVEENGAEGISILSTGDGISSLDVRDNTLILNNVDEGVFYREFVARLGSGAGTFHVDLSGNKSYNSPIVNYNFDFLNLGGLGLLYQDDGTNLGTIGSSDGSVPPPP